MDQLVILLIIAAISFINWLLQKSADHKAKRAREKQLVEQGQVGSEIVEFDDSPPSQTTSERPDDATRRLMEALGLPTDAFPPAPVERELPPPPPLDAVPPPPPLPVRRKSFAHKIDSTLEDRLRPAEVSHWNDAASRGVRATKRANAIAGNDVPQSESAKRAMALLSSQDGLKASILAREILGPPKGLVFPE